MVVGTVAELWRYPVKSMGGERVAEVTVGATGVTGDRAYGVYVDGAEKPLSAKHEPRLLFARATYGPDGCAVTLPADGTWPVDGVDGPLSDWLGYAVTVRPGPPPPAPLHVLTTASLRAAEALHPLGEWAVSRFRPNVVVASDATGFVEDGWVGGPLRLGGMVALVEKGTVRCLMTTMPQGDVAPDAAILRTLRERHDSSLGVYAWVTSGGPVAAGDGVTAG